MPESCQRCLYNTDHPFGLTLHNGICSGCLTHEEKDQIDWQQKEEQLKTLLAQRLKTSRRQHYDCVIPVQGDAEDYYVVSKVLALGLKPLIVCVNDYFKNDIGWHNLHNLITYFDLDSFVYNPDLSVYKELIRTTLRKSNHMLWPFLALHTAFPVHIAKDRKIPMVIWGQNQSVEQVGKFSHLDEIEMSQWSRIEHDLFRQNVGQTIGNGAQVDLRHLNYYQYPQVEQLGKSKITGIYLSNYYRWDPYYQNSQMKEYGFIPQENTASYDNYERAGSSIYYQIHDLLKFKRRGYRKIRDHLTRDIRHGRITRQDTKVMEEHYSAAKVDVSPFFNWLGMTETGEEWFIKHRLSTVDHLIDSHTEDHGKIELPDTLQSLYHGGSNPEKEFIFYGKGLHL